MTGARSAAARWRRRFEALPGNLRGAAWMIVAGMFFSAQTAFIKHLGASLPPLEIAFFRTLFAFASVVPFVVLALARGRTAVLQTQRPFLHLARGLVGVVSLVCGMYAIVLLPLATATAIQFTRPLFLVVLAVLFLGEVVRWRRWTATVVGFIGVLIVVRPGGMSFEWGTVLGLVGAAFMADVAVMVKKLSHTESNATIMFYFTLTATIATALPAAYVWQTPTAEELMFFVLIGILVSVAQWCSLRAVRAGETTAVMPFDYLRLLFAGAIGYAAFGEVPDLWTGVGAAVLVGSTLYIGLREARLAAQAGRTAGLRPPPGGL